MPLYEYGCPACGHVADVRHGFDDKPEVTCEKCGAAMTRRFSAAPIVFKGSGFYVNDSRGSNSSSKSEKSESGDKSEKSEPAKTETKTETKAEPKKDAAA
ncbi:MAG: FmdB family zinc ribbon protein [Vulcanimicrobiaceae bacterium]